MLFGILWPILAITSIHLVSSELRYPNDWTFFDYFSVVIFMCLLFLFGRLLLLLLFSGYAYFIWKGDGTTDSAIIKYEDILIIGGFC
jgi:hypothetical protein